MEATALFTLSFFFLSFTTNGVHASRGISITNQPPAVLDSSGNELRKGQYYYLLPSMALPFLYTSAIVPAIYRPETIWLQLEIEKFYYGITGVPVKIMPVGNSEDESIRVSTDLHIGFDSGQVWKVDEVFEPFVTVVEGHGDKSSWFKIEKTSEVDDRTYKLVSSSGRDVGISDRTYGTKRLALSDEPLPFAFLPEKEAQALTASSEGKLSKVKFAK